MTTAPDRPAVPDHAVRRQWVGVIALIAAMTAMRDLRLRDRSAHGRGLLLDLVEGERAVLPRSSADDRLVYPLRHRDLLRHQFRRPVRRNPGDAGHPAAVRRHRPARDP